MDSITLEQIIRTHVYLSPSPDPKGWFRVLCKVCNDHGKKGLRGGFKFDDKGIVGYNCFNCGHKTKYDPTARDPNGNPVTMPAKMVQVLDAYGIDKQEWGKVLFEAMRNRHNGQGTAAPATHEESSIEPAVLTLPPHFYPLKDASPDDKWAEIARDYLEGRGYDPDLYPYYLSISQKTGVATIDKWRGRLIIPFYKNEKLIYYQGRSLYETKKKYESPSAPKECVLYGFDRLFEHTETPLYVMEGFFDAVTIDGVALLGNELSESQAKWLKQSRRKKVYIPDKFGDGQRAALDFIERGWAVSTPDIGNCKDVSAAVLKYGKLYVLKSIVDKTFADPFSAKLNLGAYCEVKSNEGKAKNQNARSRKR